MKKLGYIGLGAMGAPIATNLASAGYDLTVWNRTAEKCQSLDARGAHVATSLKALGRSGCEAVFLNLSDGPAVHDLLFGTGNLAAFLVAGTVVIDNSTIAPGEAQAIAAELQQRGIDFLDAPVSGGPGGAEAGTLSIMVGGDEAVFERCRLLFDAIGKTITHLGPVGMGQACKACNQAAVVCNLLGVCEAAALAKKLGLDPQKMLEVVNAGGGASFQLKKYGGLIFAGDLQPGFMVKLMLKDLGIIRASADAVKLPMQGTSLAESYLQQVADSGGAELGTQAMSQAVEKLGEFRFADSTR